MYIGEWKNHYDPSRFRIDILDCTQWSIKFEFSKGAKIVEKSGSNDYHYNFDKLLELFEIESNE